MKNSMQPKSDTRADEATYAFPDNSAAWVFYRACLTAGIVAGYPSLRAHDIRDRDSRSVAVLLPTRMDRETADVLAGCAPCAYAFGR